MKRKIICLILAAAMLVCLSGCGSTEAPVETPEPTAGITPEAVPEPVAPEETVEEPFAYTLPLFEETKTFSYWKCLPDIPAMADGFNDNLAYQDFSEKLNVKLDFISCAGTVESEKFNIMLASGDYPDLIANIGNLYSGSLDTLIDEEILLDFTPYVNDYMPLYKAMLDGGGDKFYLQATTEKGAMAAICTYTTDGPGVLQYGLVIRQDWLDAVGMDAPQTYDQMTAVAKAFQTELRATEAIHYLGAYDFCEGYGVLGYNFNFNPFAKAYQGFYLKDGTNKVTFGIIEEGYREYVEMIRGWFAEGLISQEFASRNQNRNGAEAAAARYGDYCGIFGIDPKLIDTVELEHSNPDFEMTAITYPMKNSGETLHLAERFNELKQYLAVTTACDDPEGAATFLDWWFSWEGDLMRNYGVEGLTYTLDGEGQPVYTELYTENDGSIVSDAEFSQYYFFSLISGIEHAATLDPQRYSAKSVEATSVWYSNMDDDWYLPALSVSGEDGENYTAKFGDITTYCAENVFKFIYGERSMDEWDDFLATLGDLGIDECIAAWQNAYDAYVGRLD